jgi:hypothetical protein
MAALKVIVFLYTLRYCCEILRKALNSNWIIDIQDATAVAICFRDVGPCSLREVNRRFEGEYCLNIHG